MRYLFFLLICWACQAQAPLSTESDEGLLMERREFEGYSQSFAYARLSAKQLGRLKLLSAEGRSLAQLFKEEPPILALNAGMFHPNYEAVGLLVLAGEERRPLVLGEGRGNFFLQPNGVFWLDRLGRAGIAPSPDYAQMQPEAFWASQSGPLLLYQGEIHPAFRPSSKNKFIRNGLGIDSLGRLHLIQSLAPINFYRFAQLFQELECHSALYFDGVISQMYMQGIGRLADYRRPLGPVLYLPAN
ncbi:phosphodiester glycosidase family protein [Saprospira grandis]|uniref:phosphodiester glycosidase family protein n=1 Tax=Saprospira grandis TaxID=1008 RepID=UPI0022DDCC4B|nr:phosphodiester glycosidase family protein [Saprospira grandis]WBM73478.1 phosphodiester glycosidase family protein [Saprospira grandis]